MILLRMRHRLRGLRAAVLVWMGAFCWVLFADLLGQDRQAGNLKIRVGVEEVRLDAVVVDMQGHPITDLAAEDFEVYQDGKRQKLVSCQYVRYFESQPAMLASSPGTGRSLPPIPAPMLKREAVRRTIVFLVNDLFMGFTEVVDLRRALRKFVETQMRPGDAVAIMRTSTGNAALQTLSADKRQLLAVIENTQYGNGYFRINPFLPVEERQKVPFKIHMNGIGYCIKAMENLPGRKFLVLMTSRITLPSCPKITDALNYVPCTLDTSKYQMQANRLADAAWRAGVVIHTLDMRGLTFDPLPDDDQRLLPLSQRTGGLLLMNRNFAGEGIKDVEEEMQGYYLLTYVPPKDTFQPSGRSVFHDIQIKVKRPFSTVRTRAGFGGGDEPVDALTVRQKTPLMEAMFSPFQHGDLKISLASGYAGDARKGYSVRAWLHLDGQTLGIRDERDGGRSIALEVSAAATDINGIMKNLGSRTLAFRVQSEDVRWIRDHGFRFAMVLPIRKPGGYYIRVAAQDQVSGAMGSAYQFMEIPNLKKKSLALSSMVIVNSDDDASWLLSQAKHAEAPASAAPSGVLRESQALRSYVPGETFEYMAVIYHAKAPKKLRPDLESQTVLYRNGEEVQRSAAEMMDLGGVADYASIPFRRKFTLDNTLKPGDYVLQLLIRDRRADAKNSQAAQALLFELK